MTPRDSSVTTDTAVDALAAVQVDAQRELWHQHQTTGWGALRLRLTKILAALQWPIFLGTVCLGTKLPGERLSISFLLLGGAISVAAYVLALSCLLQPITKRELTTLGALVVGLGAVIPAGLGMTTVLPWALMIILIGGYAYTHFLEWHICRLDPFAPEQG